MMGLPSLELSAPYCRLARFLPPIETEPGRQIWIYLGPVDYTLWPGERHPTYEDQLFVVTVDRDPGDEQ